MKSKIKIPGIILSIVCAGILAGTILGQSHSESKQKNLKIIGVRMVDIDGKIRRPGINVSVRPVLMVFLNPTCPISRRYIPELNKLYKRARGLEVDFYGVFSDPRNTRSEIIKYRKSYKIKFPILQDHNGELALKLSPRVTPESFLIGKDDSLVYRGRIDNRFVSIGKLRRKITSRDLHRALEATGQGKKYEGPVKTPPVGCIFESWRDGQLPQNINYNRNIAPLLQANCAGCHKKNGIGPFPLLTYQDARRRAEMIGFVTKKRFMPPWHAKENYGHFRDERRLSDRQIDLIQAWLKAGAPRGAQKNAPPPVRLASSRWPLGKPDKVLEMQESFTVPAEGEDIYRYFVIPSGMLNDRTIRAIDFRPGDAAVVHHCNFFVDYSGKARRLDQKDPGPGFSVFKKGSFMSYDSGGAMGAWAPGSDPYKLPPDMGMYLPAGGDIVFEIHYHLNGKATKDKSALALYFAKKPVKEYVDGLFLGTQDLDIPPGEKNYQRHIRMKVPADVRLIDIAPHMHYLGKEARARATLPDGRTIPLIHLQNWDIRWQNVYIFREPIFLPRGSTIDVYFRFDNSADNPANPHLPPKRTRWGWGTDEEMSEIYMAVIPANPEEMKALTRAARATWRQNAEPGVSKDEPSVATIDANIRRLAELALWTSEGEERMGELARMAEMEKILKRTRAFAKGNPGHPGYQTLHGVLLSVAIEYVHSSRKQYRMATEADEYFGKALSIEPDYYDARLARAALYLFSGERRTVAAGRAEMNSIIKTNEKLPAHKKRPEHARAFELLGDYYKQSGKEERAREIWKRGLRFYPRNTGIREKLK